MRLIAACLASLAIYLTAFTLILDRPLSLGLLRLEIQQKTARLTTMPTPKLVILAGSNGPYSHSCAVIGAMLKMPCENAGIAVGIGLDYLLAAYAPALHRGDVVYLPMEFSQYEISRAENDSGVDAAILLRHDRPVLLTMPPDRILAAAFSGNFQNLLESTIEMPMTNLISPRATLAAEYNCLGDRINHSLATARPERLTLAAAPETASITDHYGAALIAAFVARETEAGVTIIGGLPTGYDSAPPSQATIASIRALYTTNGARFIALPNLSRYPVDDFYDSPDHLAQPCQFKHSIAIAKRLAEALNKPITPPSAAITNSAATCPD